MSIVTDTVVDAPRSEVFDWHARPGAILRLMPPWQPLRVLAEAESLRDGRAVLALPLGMRWVAAHDPAGYDPPGQFVDEVARGGVAALPAGLLVSWRHTHQFEELTRGRTRLIDRVDTPVPARALAAGFEYRYRQLADDLAAHRRADMLPRTIAVTGASGLVGSALTAFLSTGGHRVISLVRHAPRNDSQRQWDPEAPAPDLLEGVDAVIHLAGASIAGRFTVGHKQAIRDSRVGPTRLLAELAARTDPRPAAFVSASAIGWYGPDRGDTPLTETSSQGSGFLADLVADWEAATAPAEIVGIRCVQVRTGIVQSARGGVLQMLRPLFGSGLGGRLGSGDQWLSWIGIDDLLDVYHRALYDSRLTGPVNAVAPEPVRNIDYTRTLATVVHRPAILPVPSLGPRILLGSEGADELAFADQRVVPAVLHDVGHRFRRPSIEAALRHELGKFTGALS